MKKLCPLLTLLHPNTKGTPLQLHIFSRAEQGVDFVPSARHPLELGSVLQSLPGGWSYAWIRELIIYSLPGRSRWHFNFPPRWCDRASQPQ